MCISDSASHGSTRTILCCRILSHNRPKLGVVGACGIETCSCIMSGMIIYYINILCSSSFAVADIRHREKKLKWLHLIINIFDTLLHQTNITRDLIRSRCMIPFHYWEKRVYFGGNRTSHPWCLPREVIATRRHPIEEIVNGCDCT